MSADPFASLPDEARLWVLPLARPATPAEEEALRKGLAEILGRWRHKGHAYDAAWELREACLVLVAEPSMAREPSGCAIDGMLQKLHRLIENLGIGVLSEHQLLLRREGRLLPVPRSDLGPMLSEGLLDGGTPLVDPSLTHLGQLRQGRLEQPLARTWVGRKFGIPSAS